MSNPLYQAFIITLDDIYEFVETKCPQLQDDINLSRLYTSSLQTISCSLLVNEIYKVLKPFKQQILDCNQSFFLDFGNSNLQDSHQFLNLKDIWLSDTLSILDKAHAWHLFQQLVKISDKLTL